MKMMVTLSSLLFGALVASSGFNVYHATSATEGEVSRAAEEVVFPVPSQPSCVLTPKLDLTTGQQQRLASCCPTYFQQRMRFQKRIDVLVARLEKELNAKSPDARRIYELVEAVGEARTGELRSCVRSILQVRSTLTPGQLSKLAGCCGQE